MNTIALTQIELSTGMLHERLILEAQTMLNERIAAQALYIQHLRAIHSAPPADYDLLDWYTGFSVKPKEITNG